MRRHRIATLLAFALLVGACSGRAPSGSPSGTSPPTTQGPLDGCVPTGQASLVDLGGGHQAAVLGSGGNGVVLSNQSDQNLCGWLPFGKVLAERGFRVLLYDYGAATDPAGDVALAAAKLRSLGAGTVQLVGAAAGAKLQATLVGFLRGHGTAATTTTAAAAGSAVSARCGPPVAAASLIHFRATDGTRLDGALVGSGRTGVVLLHQYPNNLCGFWPYAVYLAGKGLRVLDIDLRCFGESACPVNAKGSVMDDVAGAVAELRRRGASSVALVGASAGASTALIAGAKLGTKVSSVVSLSGERDLILVMGASGPADAVPLVKHLVSPTLFVVATNDRTTTVEETQAMYAATAAKDKRLEILQGPYEGDHGWDLLTETSNGQSWSTLAAQVAAFVKAHA